MGVRKNAETRNRSVTTQAQVRVYTCETETFRSSRAQVSGKWLDMLSAKPLPGDVKKV